MRSPILFLIALYALIATYESQYMTASGMKCIGFGFGDHELGTCYGRFSR